MKKTANPDAPLKDEAKILGRHCALKRVSPNDPSAKESAQSYDFMNFPEAIPEEVFVYFGNQVESMKDLEKVSQREIFLNLHFMKHYFSILE